MFANMFFNMITMLLACFNMIRLPIYNNHKVISLNIYLTQIRDGFLFLFCALVLSNSLSGCSLSSGKIQLSFLI